MNKNIIFLLLAFFILSKINAFPLILKCAPGYVMENNDCVPTSIKCLKDCKYGFKPDSFCTCNKGFPVEKGIPVVTSDKIGNKNKCSIKRCLKGYHVNKAYCQCRLNQPHSCKLKCNAGFIAQSTTCGCFQPETCKIKRCRNGSKLDKNECACRVPKVVHRCQIKSCHLYHKIIPDTCECQIISRATCKKGCRLQGEILYHPCNCMIPPICTIKACKQYHTLNQTECKCHPVHYDILLRNA